MLKCEFGATNTSPDDYDPSGSSPGSNGQTHVVSLWMNPGSGTLGQANGEILASQNPTGNLGSYFAAVDAYGTATADSSAINSFAIFGHRQNTPASIAMDIDELRIGRTWADVTPTAAPEHQAILTTTERSTPATTRHGARTTSPIRRSPMTTVSATKQLVTRFGEPISVIRPGQAAVQDWMQQRFQNRRRCCCSEQLAA